PASPVITNRASTMLNSTWSSTATTATSSPGPPRASPMVTPSRPITLAAGQPGDHEPGQHDAEQHLEQHGDHRHELARPAAGQPDGHPEQADHVGRRP